MTDKLTKVQLLQDLDNIDNILKFNESEQNFAKNNFITRFLDEKFRATTRSLSQLKDLLTDTRKNGENVNMWRQPSGDDRKDIEQWYANKQLGGKILWILQWYERLENKQAPNKIIESNDKDSYGEGNTSKYTYRELRIPYTRLGAALSSGTVDPKGKKKFYVCYGNSIDGDVLVTVTLDSNTGKVVQGKKIYQREISNIALGKSGKPIFRYK